MSLLQEIEQHGLADCEFNNRYFALTDNQKTFVEAINSIGDVPVEAAIDFATMEGNDFYHNSKYHEYYSKLADCWGVFHFATETEKRRCISICESMGTESDGHYCADEIGVNHG